MCSSTPVHIGLQQNPSRTAATTSAGPSFREDRSPDGILAHAISLVSLTRVDVIPTSSASIAGPRLIAPAVQNRMASYSRGIAPA
jgi:hypothetical protein